MKQATGGSACSTIYGETLINGSGMLAADNARSVCINQLVSPFQWSSGLWMWELRPIPPACRCFTQGAAQAWAPILCASWQPATCASTWTTTRSCWRSHRCHLSCLCAACIQASVQHQIHVLIPAIWHTRYSSVVAEELRCPIKKLDIHHKALNRGGIHGFLGLN